MTTRVQPKSVYTIKEAADQLGIGTSNCYKKVREGTIPNVRLGGKWLIPIKAFETWLNSEVGK